MLLSVRSGDEAAFERNYAQLRVYYGDARGAAGLAPSGQEASLTGLNLLRLLVQGRTAEFHTELEVVPPELLAAPEVAQVRAGGWGWQGAAENAAPLHGRPWVPTAAMAGPAARPACLHAGRHRLLPQQSPTCTAPLPRWWSWSSG